MKCTCPTDEVISERRDPMVQWMSNNGIKLYWLGKNNDSEIVNWAFFFFKQPIVSLLPMWFIFQFHSSLLFAGVGMSGSYLCPFVYDGFTHWKKKEKLKVSTAQQGTSH